MSPSPPDGLTECLSATTRKDLRTMSRLNSPTEETLQLVTATDAEGSVQHNAVTVTSDKYGAVRLQATHPTLFMLPSQARQLARALTAAAKGNR